MKQKTAEQLLILLRSEASTMMKIPRGNRAEFKSAKQRFEKLLERYQAAGGNMDNTLADKNS